MSLRAILDRKIRIINIVLTSTESKEVQYFEAGKQRDKDTVYYDSGEIRFIYSFENDKKNGWMYRYSKAGRQEFAALYKNDLVSEVIDSLNLDKK